MIIVFIILYLMAAFSVAMVGTEGFVRGSVWRALGESLLWPLICPVCFVFFLISFLEQRSKQR